MNPSCETCIHFDKDHIDAQGNAPCYGVPPVLVPEKIDGGYQGQVTDAMRWPARWPHTHKSKRCPNHTPARAVAVRVGEPSIE